MRETQVWSLGWKDPLETGMATHSTILVWKIPWIEEPGELQSIGLQKVGHNWATNTLTFILVFLFCAFLFLLFIFPFILCVVSVFRRFGFIILLSHSNYVWMLASFLLKIICFFFRCGNIVSYLVMGEERRLSWFTRFLSIQQHPPLWLQ